MDMRNDLSEDTVLIVMDFTDEQVNSDHHQDLIVTYITKHAAPYPLPIKKRRTSTKSTRTLPTNHIEYFHYIAEPKTSNDVHFVAEVFTNHILPRIKRFKNAHIFSDGGPKHFKISSLLHHISQAVSKLDTLVHYHFYASYHGHGICDAAASHAKAAIVRSINAKQKTPKSAQEICDTVNSVRNHRAIPLLATTVPVVDVKTMNGIRSYHKYFFDSGVIIAYETSESEEVATYFFAQEVKHT
jgi:hypothetical protein